jgi:MFS family permease
MSRGLSEDRDRSVEPVRVGTAVRLLVFIEFTSGFLQFGMVPLLPRIGDRLDVTDGALSWVIAITLLAGAVCVPVLGRLGDRYGHRRVLRVSVALVALGTVVVAVAPSFGLLLAGRVLQGPLAALLPLEIALVRGVLTVADARRAIALLVGSLTAGALFGTVTTGAVETATGDVRLALLVLAAMTLACVPLCFLGVPESPSRPDVRMDWPGAVLFGAGTSAVLIGLSDADRLIGIGVGAALLVVFAVVELRVRDPLIDLRAMAQRHVLPYYGAAALFGVAFFGSKAPNTSFLATAPENAGYGFGLSAFAISLMLLPATACSVVGSLCTARLGRLLGYRACVIGAFTMIATGYATLALVRDQLPAIALAMAVCGSGIGLVLGALPTIIVEGAPADRSGIATALYNNTKLIGGALAGGGVAALMARWTPAGTSLPREQTYLAVWLVAAACAAVAALAVVYAGSVREIRSDSQAEGADSSGAPNRRPAVGEVSRGVAR